LQELHLLAREYGRGERGRSDSLAFVVPRLLQPVVARPGRLLLVSGLVQRPSRLPLMCPPIIAGAAGNEAWVVTAIIGAHSRSVRFSDCEGKSE
jgi:hypothetical protein